MRAVSIAIAVAGLVGVGTLAFALTGPEPTPQPRPAASAETGAAAETRRGASGLKVPRFVSLKSGEVNLREGPSTDHAVSWVYVKRGLPVEVTAEFDNWRRIRDADGVSGWVHKSMLDGRRTVLILGGEPLALRRSAEASAAVAAYLAPGVIAALKSCDAARCEVEAGPYDGYVPRDRLWGVYPGEDVN